MKDRAIKGKDELINLKEFKIMIADKVDIDNMIFPESVVLSVLDEIKNLPVVFKFDYSLAPIGKIIHARYDNKELLVVVKFADKKSEKKVKWIDIAYVMKDSVISDKGIRTVLKVQPVAIGVDFEEDEGTT